MHHLPNAFPTATGQSLLLSQEQQSILQSTAPSAVISALAGTGKTTTLACRAAETLRTQADARILVLAYSKAGVEAFKHRLQSLIPYPSGNIQITTLERWCARMLRQRDAGVSFVTDAVKLRNYAQQALSFLEEQLQRYPDTRLELPTEVDMQAFAAFNRAAKKSLMLQRLNEEGCDLAEFCDAYMLDYTQARLFTAYERIRIDDCGDTRFYAEGDCTYALAKDSPFEDVPPYDWVLFDEMHDLDLASLTVLRNILQQSNARFLGAGDFNQHIETQAWSVFQDKLHQLADFLPHATESLPLTQSRRFGPQIAQAVNRWFDVAMKAPSTRYSTVTQWTYTNDAQCLDLLLKAQTSISQTSQQHHTPLTVILRHAHDACAIEWHMNQAGKTVSLYGLKPFYLHRDIALLLGLLYVHGIQAPDWKSSTCILDTRILSAFIDGALYFGKGSVHAHGEGSALSIMAAQMHVHPQGIWRFLLGETSLQGGQRNFSAFGNFLQLPLALQANATALLEKADIWGLFSATPMSHDEQEKLQARVRSFLNAIAGLSVPQVLQHVAHISARTEKAQHYGQGFDFQLLSIEQAKGQEFEYVALPFLQPGRFPAPSPKETAFLERNRMYVAMTRAKYKLWLIENATNLVQAFDPTCNA